MRGFMKKNKRSDFDKNIDNLLKEYGKALGKFPILQLQLDLNNNTYQSIFTDHFMVYQLEMFLQGMSTLSQQNKQVIFTLREFYYFFSKCHYGERKDLIKKLASVNKISVRTYESQLKSAKTLVMGWLGGITLKISNDEIFNIEQKILVNKK